MMVLWAQKALFEKNPKSSLAIYFFADILLIVMDRYFTFSCQTFISRALLILRQ